VGRAPYLQAGGLGRRRRQAFHGVDVTAQSKGKDMTKSIEETNNELEGLSAAELSQITGGAYINVYSNGGFYSGSNVHSPFKQKKSNKKKR
jgi:hypothetical protein